jgi:hypothetical protein
MLSNRATHVINTNTKEMTKIYIQYGCGLSAPEE